MKYLEGASVFRFHIPYGGEGVRVGDFIVRTNPKGGYDNFYIIAPDGMEILYGENAKTAPRSDRRVSTSLNVLGVRLWEDQGVKVGEAASLSVVGVGAEGMLFDIQSLNPLDPTVDVERLPAGQDHKLYLRRYLTEQGVLPDSA